MMMLMILYDIHICMIQMYDTYDTYNTYDTYVSSSSSHKVSVVERLQVARATDLTIDSTSEWENLVRHVFGVERTQRVRVWPSSRVWLYHFIFPHGPSPREVAVICAEVQIAKTHCRCRALLQRTLNLAVSAVGQGATSVHPTSSNLATRLQNHTSMSESLHFSI